MATLHGESSFLNLGPKEVCFVTPAGHAIPGNFQCTNYMLYFQPDRTATPANFRHVPLSFFRVPLGIIERLVIPDSKRKKSDRRASPSWFSLDIGCRDVRRMRFCFKQEGVQRQVYGLIKVLAFPASIKDVFAFAHMDKTQTNLTTGWEVYNLKGEFIRQGVFDVTYNKRASWRECTLNEEFKFCGTYPNVLVVPATMSDVELNKVAAFRSRQRIPAFTWIHPGNHTTLWRSSQPMVGVRGNTCREDEMMLERVRISSAISSKSPLLIADCRPILNAMGNKAQGKGWETYKNTTIEFFGIQSIHVMRDSFAKLKSLCLKTDALQTVSKDFEWGNLVEETGWLKHVRGVLCGGVRIARAMHEQGLSVLCHCSDGWDRTAQCVCIAQMLMDPYYRTLKGFCTLIAKDWLCFGHQFQHRIGHADPAYDNSQRSPVFIQFLDCVYQLVSLFPDAFEFNTRLMMFLAHHVFSCRFGDFLLDCLQQRTDTGLFTSTPCIFGFVMQNSNNYTNRGYNPDSPPVLLPPSSLVARNVHLWKDYFLRFSPVPSSVPRRMPFASYAGAKGAAGVSDLLAPARTSVSSMGALTSSPGPGAGAGAGAGAGRPVSLAARLSTTALHTPLTSGAGSPIGRTPPPPAPETGPVLLAVGDDVVDDTSTPKPDTEAGPGAGTPPGGDGGASILAAAEAAAAATAAAATAAATEAAAASESGMETETADTDEAEADSGSATTQGIASSAAGATGSAAGATGSAASAADTAMPLDGGDTTASEPAAAPSEAPTPDHSADEESERGDEAGDDVDSSASNAAAAAAAAPSEPMLT